MKIRSIDELEDYLAKEYSWRRKELTNIRNLSLAARSSMKDTLFKAAVVLLYSHWEGFVKNTAIAFCEYLNSKGIPYVQLNKNFHVCAVLKHFQGQYPHKNFNSVFKIIDGVSIDLSQSYKINSEKYIDIKDNLNSTVMREITAKIGLDYSHYELKEKFIDERFLALRNAISHGEYRDISNIDLTELYDEIVPLLDVFKNQVLDSVAKEAFMAGSINYASNIQ